MKFSKYHFFIIVIICIICSAYFYKKNNFIIIDKNLIQNTKKIKSESDLSNSQSINSIKSQSYDTEKESLGKSIIESAPNQSIPSALPTSESNDIPKQSNIKTEYSPPSLHKYIEKMPRIYKKIYENTPGIDYNLPLDYSAEHLAYLKKLSDQGDAKGKFLYANRLWAFISDSYYQDYLLKGNMINKDYWRSQFEEIRKLYIEAAVAGISWAASQLPVLPPQIEQDTTEELAWALITDKMEGQQEKLLTIKCEKVKEQCTDEELEKALDRAKFYLDFYNFKATEKSNDAN